MAEVIEHTGIVKGVTENSVEVEMTVREACAQCRARAVCGTGAEERRFITVYTEQARAFQPGEEVVVSVSQGMGLRAAVFAYVIPFLLLLAVLLGTLEAGLSEPQAGVVSLAVLAVYYFALWLARGRFEKEIIFKIRKS